MAEQPLTPERLAELKAIADKAPPRPWRCYPENHGVVYDDKSEFVGKIIGRRTRLLAIAAVNNFDALLEMAESAIGKPTECRRCTECIGASHHWIADPQADPDLPEYGCKHCSQRGCECSACGGAGRPLCNGEGVIATSTAEHSIEQAQYSCFNCNSAFGPEVAVDDCCPNCGCTGAGFGMAENDPDLKERDYVEKLDG